MDFDEFLSDLGRWAEDNADVRALVLDGWHVVRR
jgi:hypothetical protein